ncbi:hypothetical protein [Geothrix terrae]|uniref:hypothetical protein n=1 Tax=Geothrix terrae TaxID=2922720 RepID=UPI001FAC1292|nr:hypothetical protein [Geothrix terrae]
MRSILLATLPAVLLAQAPAPGPAQPPPSSVTGAKDPDPQAAALQVEPKDLAEKFKLEGLESTSGTVTAVFRCVKKHGDAEVDSKLRVPLDKDQLNLAGARWSRVAETQGEAISTSTPKPSWREVLGSKGVALDRNLLVEFFRINAFHPVGDDSARRSTPAARFRVTLLCIAPIRKEGSKDPLLKEGTRVFCIGELGDGGIRLRFSGGPWAEAHTVLGPDGTELEGPVVLLPSCDGLDLRDLDTLSTDDARTLAWWMRGNDSHFFWTPRATTLPVYSCPLDVQLYAGASWSNLYVAPSQGGSSNFFAERGLLRLEATQTWTDKTALAFFQSVIIAQVEPEKSVEVKDLSGMATAIRTTRGFLGAVDLSLGYAFFQHANLGLGVRLSAQQERVVPVEADGSPVPSAVPFDQVVNQRHIFLRLQQQDPQWRGSFFEIGLTTWDERFRDPAVPENEKRRLFRGRVAFRPEKWSATSFFLEASMNRATNNRSKLPEESRIQVGIRVDLKIFSMPTWPF